MPLYNPNIKILTLGGSLHDPADGATNYFGVPSPLITAVPALAQARMPKCRIISARLGVTAIVTGSGESATVNLRVNDTTNHLISSSVVYTALHQSYSANLSVDLNEGDMIEAQVVYPSFSSNPTGVVYGLSLHYV